MCPGDYLSKEIQLIKNYGAWKKNIVWQNVSNIQEENNADAVKIYLKFSGNTADRIIKKSMKKVYKCFKKEVVVKSVLHYETTKF